MANGKLSRGQGAQRAGGWILPAPMLVFILLMFVFPAYSVIRTSFLDGELTSGGGFTLRHYVTFFTDDLYLRSLANTMKIAVVTTVITAVLGLIYAYQLVVRPKFRQLQLALLLTPLLINGVVRLFGLQLGLTALNNFLLVNGIISAPLPLNYSFTGIIIALVSFQFPFMTMAIYASLSRLDTTLVEAAETLGASRLSVLAHIIFPLAIPGMVAGSVLTFASAAGTFVVPAMMGGGMINTVPQMIYSAVSQSLQWAAASAFAVILVVILVVPIMIGGKLGDRDTTGGR